MSGGPTKQRDQQLQRGRFGAGRSAVTWCAVSQSAAPLRIPGQLAIVADPSSLETVVGRLDPQWFRAQCDNPLQPTPHEQGLLLSKSTRTRKSDRSFPKE